MNIFNNLSVPVSETLSSVIRTAIASKFVMKPGTSVWLHPENTSDHYLLKVSRDSFVESNHVRMIFNGRVIKVDVENRMTNESKSMLISMAELETAMATLGVAV